VFYFKSLIDFSIEMSPSPSYQFITFKQPGSFKFGIYLLALSLAVFSGICAGILCLYLTTSLFFPIELDIGFFFGIISIVAIFIWMVETVRSNIVSGSWKSALTSFIAILLMVTLFKRLDLFFLIFFLFFALIVTLICFLGSNLALALGLILTELKKRHLKLVLLILIIPSSVLVAFLLIPTSPSKIQFFNNYSKIIKATSAGLIPFLIANISWTVFGFENTPKQEFAFLRSWAVTIASWGGTSFYKLDLSRIDFTGSKIAHTDFRANKFYRTCLRDVKGLDRARVDNRYFDLEFPKVQELLTTGNSRGHDFSRVNLRGAYLQNADLRQTNLSEANLDGADLSGADLRESTLVRSILTSADLSRADLTGACIKDWSFNDQTCLTGVKCDYVYREFENDQPTDRYPNDRNFKPGEFESLFQKLTNAVELVFQEQVDWRALSFAFEKFQIEDDGMGLELKGVEQRGDYWIVKVAHGEGVSKQRVERRVQSTYDDLRVLMETKDKQINQLLGIVDNQTKAMNQQAEALTNFSKHPFGNNFFISGSTITNLAGSGQIEYREAADRVRSIVTNRAEASPTMQQLFSQLSDQNVATTAATQQELFQQILLSEAEQDPAFRQFLLEQGQQMVGSLPSGEIAIALQNAIAQLKPSQT
jgi:uncharacterized protein YjbI with pentapeptide repeats